MLEIVDGIDGIVAKIEDSHGVWLEIKGLRSTYDESIKCFLLGVFTKRPVLLAVGLPNHEIFQEYPPWNNNMFFYKCYECGNIKIDSSDGDSFLCSDCNGTSDKKHPNILSAIEMAQKARFEHRQTG